MIAVKSYDFAIAITGAKAPNADNETSGIGKATAIAFADAGAKVVLTDRREKEGLEVVAEIKKTGGTAAYIRTDVAEEADVVKAVDFVLSTHGRLDVAFNNAGVEIVGPLDQVTEEQYRRTFDINVWGFSMP
jgi:NAD(P)-dependent dehydrogenase (short-subunit alcohol dehydrogenase family)